jgi:hypothetical protein
MARPISFTEKNQDLTRTATYAQPAWTRASNACVTRTDQEANRRNPPEPMSWEDLIPASEQDNSVFRETVAWAYLLGVECGRRLEVSLQTQEPVHTATTGTQGCVFS